MCIRDRDVPDMQLRELYIDRIYDTFIDEEELQACDHTTFEIANSLEPRPYSSREFIWEIGKWLHEGHAVKKDSLIQTCYECGVPIFCPAFSDCSAGFGIGKHQWEHPDKHVSIDSVKDFIELTQIKIKAGTTGLFMVGGGTPKNFAQDTVVCAEILGFDVPMHKYAKMCIRDRLTARLTTENDNMKMSFSFSNFHFQFSIIFVSFANLFIKKGVYKYYRPN